jgi:hypothetical protein
MRAAVLFMRVPSLVSEWQEDSLIGNFLECKGITEGLDAVVLVDPYTE